MVLKNCEQCGTGFNARNNQKFCSEVCRASAVKARLPEGERKCRVDGCDRFRNHIEPGYCGLHHYRWENYGDPLAEPRRKKRSPKLVDLTADWSEVDVSYWTRNPTHCPAGHEYTEENTTLRRSRRDGAVRRVCKTCHREGYQRRKAGVAPTKTATCLSCGTTWEASKFGKPRFCSDCRIIRHRNKNRLNKARKRGQVPRGESYTCRACGYVSPSPTTGGSGPLLCDACQAVRDVESKRKQWRKKVLEKYSLTDADFIALIEAQGNRCAICRSTEPGGSGAWHVDHDHNCCPGGRSCGRCVRGLLCSRCNTALGLLDDERPRVESALAYLDDPPAQRVLRS